MPPQLQKSIVRLACKLMISLICCALYSYLFHISSAMFHTSNEAFRFTMTATFSLLFTPAIFCSKKALLSVAAANVEIKFFTRNFPYMFRSVPVSSFVCLLFARVQRKCWRFRNRGDWLPFCLALWNTHSVQQRSFAEPFLLEFPLQKGSSPLSPSCKLLQYASLSFTVFSPG